MTMFNSNSRNGIRNYHYYVPSDKLLHYIGLASYTRNTLSNFGKRKQNGIESYDPDVAEYFGSSSAIDALKPRLLGDFSFAFMYKFDNDTKDYTFAGITDILNTPSGSFLNLKEFQEKFDLYQKKFIRHDSNDDTQKLEAYKVQYIWSSINNSMSGCIHFHVDEYTILGSSSSGIVNLYFQGRGAGANRGVAFQPPVIAGVAKTSTGKEHAFNISESFPPGALSAPDVGGINNPNNTVAGPLRLHFNRGTGEWESGTTQVYAQMLEDMPGVPATDLPNNVDTVSNMSLRLPFTTGIAMILSDEKGNPHLSVPNSFGCQESEKEKITLVNRTPRSYVRGEKILASQVNGSWVPVPLQNGVTVAPRLVFQWSQIQKYIVNAKGFFRDTSDQKEISPSLYQNIYKLKFYNTLDTLPSEIKGNTDLVKLKRINLRSIEFKSTDSTETPIYSITPQGAILLDDFPSVPDSNVINLIPSFNYMQFFDADLIKKNLGGNNNTTNGMLKRTNVSQTQTYTDDVGVTATDVPTSWGMYFPQGYGTAGVRRLLTITNAISAAPNYKIYSSNSLAFSEYTNAAQIDKLDLKDPYFYHMPAQIALNGSKNQSIRILQMSPITAGNLVNMIQNPIKGDWLKTADGRDVYNLEPNSSAQVQFTPLSLELALSSTTIEDQGVGALNPIQGGYKKLKSNMDIVRSVSNTVLNEKSFGNAWDRIGLTKAFTIENDTSVKGYITFGKNLNNFGDNNTNLSAPTRNSLPDGGPDILPLYQGKESSNVVGIIAAKATFSLPAGGTIQINTKNKFGLRAYSVNTIGSSSFSFLFTGLSLLTQDLSGTSRKQDTVQWGSSEGGKISDLGTTALWCAVYDHCPDTVYDGRYMAPLQFNPSGSNMDFKQVNLALNTTINTQTTIPTENITIRRSALISNGGFAYTKKCIVANESDIEIKTHGSGYVVGNSVVFPIGDKPAQFTVSSIDGNGGIQSISIDTDNYGVEAYGETEKGGTINPFKNNSFKQATISGGNGADIRLKSGKVIEKLFVDRVKQYGSITKVTPDDNNGQGDDDGFVLSNKSTTFSLEKNSSGKYDIFFFFVNDILNYPEGGVLYEGYDVPPARYVNLEITTI